MNGAWRVFAGMAVVVVAAAGGGYWWTSSRAPATVAMAPHGASGGTAPSPAAAPMGAGVAAPSAAPSTAPMAEAPHSTQNEQMLGMVEKLAERLKKQPEDAEGWAMLARSYAVLGRHADAVKAYEKAATLRKEDPVLLADYADSLAMQANGVLAGEPMKLVARALKLDPRNVKALSMSGTDAFDRKDYAQAAQFWQQVVEYGGLESPMAQQVLPGLEQAKKLAKQR